MMAKVEELKNKEARHCWKMLNQHRQKIVEWSAELKKVQDKCIHEFVIAVGKGQFVNGEEMDYCTCRCCGLVINNWKYNSRKDYFNNYKVEFDDFKNV